MKLGRQRSPKNHTGDSMRPYLRAANVGWGGLKLDDVKSMNFTDAEMSTFRLNPGDLLLSEASGSPGEVGKPALWTGEIAECAFQNTLVRVRPGSSADPKYLLHFFRHEALSGAFAAGSRGVGIHHLGREALASWPVPLPSLNDQRRIAAILDRADQACVARRRCLALLNSWPQATFSQMFPDISGSTEALSDLVAEFRYGTSGKSQDSGLPTLRIPNVIRGEIDLSDLKTVVATAAEESRLALQDGDLLFVRTNGNPDNVGRSAVFDSGVIAEAGLDASRFIYASYLIRGRLLPGAAEPAFILEYLRTPAGRRQLRRASKTSAGQYNINIEGLSSLRIPAARIDAQRAFANRLDAARPVREAAQRSLDSLDELSASLQARAFSGQL